METLSQPSAPGVIPGVTGLGGPVEVWDRVAYPPQPPPVYVNVDVENGTTFADLLLWVGAAWAVGGIVVFGLTWIHNEWNIDRTLNQWYVWLFWPIAIPLRWMAYSYLKREGAQLAQKVKDRNLPAQCSSLKKKALNALVPGLGQAYCTLIEQLNRLQSQKGELKQKYLPELLAAAAVAQCNGQ